MEVVEQPDSELETRPARMHEGGAVVDALPVCVHKDGTVPVATDNALPARVHRGSPPAVSSQAECAASALGVVSQLAAGSSPTNVAAASNTDAVVDVILGDTTDTVVEMQEIVLKTPLLVAGASAGMAAKTVQTVPVLSKAGAVTKKEGAETGCDVEQLVTSAMKGDVALMSVQDAAVGGAAHHTGGGNTWDEYDVEGLRRLSRRELQDHCKANGIKANMKNAKMVEALLGLPIEEAFHPTQVPGEVRER